MASTISLKAVGLNTNPNQLELPEGSLVEATNVIINRENIIEQRRGFKLFGEPFGSSADRAKQMWEYKDRIIRHYSNKLEFQNGTLNNGVANFDEFSGDYNEAQSGLRIKKVDTAGNLYFTTSDGIKKISASNASQFSTSPGYITNAGGIKAVDFYPELVVVPNDQTSFLPQDSAVAYRILWAINDANNNLIAGAPSQREVIYNPMSNLIIQDFLRVLLALDNVSTAADSLITDGNYVSTLQIPISATAVEIYNALISLSVKLDADLLYADDISAPLIIDNATSTTIASGIYTINFLSGTPSDYFEVADKIILSGFTPTTGTLNGIQTVASVTPTSITINTAATGPVSLTAPKITSGTYSNITAPTTPDIPTPNQQLVELQNYLDQVILFLQLEPSTGTPPPISSASKVAYIDGLGITKTASVKLTITIPEGVTTNYFYQVYRSSIASATGVVSLVDITPNDELQLVYEAYPTQAEITAGEVAVFDITPDEFRGANLYTNASTGEGILQANDLPPFALDINRFKNVVFYANTRTRHRKTISLLGVQKLIDDYNNGIIPKLSIISSLGTNVYTFVTGVNEITDITTVPAASLAAAGPASYFEIYSAEDEVAYYVWYKIGTATDPAISGKTGLVVIADALDTDAVIAQKTRDVFNSVPGSFAAESALNVVTVGVTKPGNTTDATDGTSGFTINVVDQGRGEDASINQVLLSSSVSVATAVDETARSLVRVINKNTNEEVYAYYLSGSNDVPGKIALESKSLEDIPFYLVANNDNTGVSFTPDIGPTMEITSITTGFTPIVTTAANHGLSNDDVVVISLTDSTPAIDGLYNVKVLSPTTFEIQVNIAVTVAGTEGVGISSADVVTSENERKVNRVYYSKLGQPEAVPLLNFLDVGDSDKEILRIFPLRDSLFVFKEDGVYRISGETAPFTLALFDSSCILTAPDSLDVSNNLLYGITTQGISSVSEGGATVISVNIDNTIDQVKILNNHKTLSFGVGYESENSYTLYTVQAADDVTATIGYRYSTKTNTWTTFDKEVTCGFVNPVDTLLYFGAGDINQIEQERKSLTRLDYADREYPLTLLPSNYIGNVLQFLDVSGIEPGDVLLQEQTLSPYEFNMFLKKLDIDPGISDNNYFATLNVVGGDNLRTKIVALATKLDADPGVADNTYLASVDSKSGTITDIQNTEPVVITSTAHGLFSGRMVSITGSDSTPTVNGNWEVTTIGPNNFSIPTEISLTGSNGSWGTLDSNFNDIVGCYNIIISKLNADTGVAFANYRPATNTTTIEAIVTAVDRNQKKVTLNLTLDYIQGPITQYKGIKTSVIYGPTTFGDPINYKHLREATVMFINKAFSNAELAFSTDLLPQFVSVPFSGDGNGIFGHSSFGTGFFGGASHGAPFRTYVPRQCQRCRYILVQFQHSIARESYGIYGISITGENTQSSRAYRG